VISALRPTPAEATQDTGVLTAGRSVAGLLGLLLLTGCLTACNGQTPAQTACEADLMLQPLAVDAAVPIGGAVAGPGGAVTAQMLTAADAPLHAKIVKDCATILPVAAPAAPATPLVVQPAAPAAIQQLPSTLPGATDPPPPPPAITQDGRVRS
jgi:hypothetical protein